MPPTPPTPDAPPTTPGPIPAIRPDTTWPTPVGVISVVFGVLGFLGNAINLLSPLFIGAIQGAMPAAAQGQMDAQNAVTRRWFPVTIPIAAVQAALAIALLVAGLLLLSRRRAGRGAAIWWAVLKVVAVAVGACVGALVQADMAEAMRATGQIPAGTAPMMKLFAMLGIVVWLIVGWAWPAFVLVWLNRPAIRREVAAWA